MATKPHLPISRINTIMKSSSDAEIISKESSAMMAKATELFIRTLAQEGYKLTNQGKKLDYKHLADVVNTGDKYVFVRDIMPKKITVLEYKNIIGKKIEAGDEASESDSNEGRSGGENNGNESSDDTE